MIADKSSWDDGGYTDLQGDRPNMLTVDGSTEGQIYMIV